MSSTEETPGSSTPRNSYLPGTFPSPRPSSEVSTQRTLAQAVYDRRNEFIVSQKIRIKVGTWNVAGLEGAEKDVQGWFVQGKGVSESLSGLRISSDQSDSSSNDTKEQKTIESVVDQERRSTSKETTIPSNDIAVLPGGDDIGLYVLGLQEIVDISSAAEALRPYNDPNPSRKWKDAVSKGLPSGYDLVAEQQLSGLLLLIYASPKVAPSISSVSTTSVGTGLMGYMGNKGGTIARIVLGETTRMVFVNSHLAAGTEKGSLDRRNWDASQIVQRTRFSPIDRGHGVVDEVGENIGDEDFAFWFGDLNYRLGSIPGDDVRRLLMLHTRNEYDSRQSSMKKIESELAKSGIGGGNQDPSTRASTDTNASSHTRSSASETSSITLLDQDEFNPDEDPASLQTTISSLLPHDQLHEQIRTGKAFRDGWQEGPIKFLPTYKYDVGSVGMFDSSEKRRSPSWCDRILYRTRKDYLQHRENMKQVEDARKRDQEMKARGLENAGEEIIFDYDPETDGAEEDYDENETGDSADVEANLTKTGHTDSLHLDYYTSHQRVLSSDHKPLDAVFSLSYEAVDPELRAKVHQELARELDKTENETRPNITIVFDHSEEGQPDESINFNNIRYDEPRSRTLTVANTSPVPTTFGFAERGNGTVVPSWIHVIWSRPTHGETSTNDSRKELTLEPGDSTNLELIAKVSSIDDVRAFNSGNSKPEDVLVLRVNDGRDHFIPVRATWLKSSFGMSLQKLVRVPESGIRSENQNPDPESEEPKWSAPRELFRLTEALEEALERAVAEWGMKDAEQSKPPWDTAGWPFTRDSWKFTDPSREAAKLSIRESLDTGSPITLSANLASDQKVEALAETLLTFLSSLDGGIIDDSLWHTLSTSLLERERSKRPAPSAEDQRSHILDIVSHSPARSVSFTFITFMLARVVNEIAPLHSPEGESLPASPVVTLKTPDALLKRARGLSSDPRVVWRREVEKKVAAVFAGVLFCLGEEKGWKERRAGEERRRGVVEMFLRGRWEDGM